AGLPPGAAGSVGGRMCAAAGCARRPEVRGGRMCAAAGCARRPEVRGGRMCAAAGCAAAGSARRPADAHVAAAARRGGAVLVALAGAGAVRALVVEPEAHLAAGAVALIVGDVARAHEGEGLALGDLALGAGVGPAAAG